MQALSPAYAAGRAGFCLYEGQTVPEPRQSPEFRICIACRALHSFHRVFHIFCIFRPAPALNFFRCLTLSLRLMRIKKSSHVPAAAVNMRPSFIQICPAPSASPDTILPRISLSAFRCASVLRRRTGSYRKKQAERKSVQLVFAGRRLRLFLFI